MACQRRLLVEGPDDEHVVKHICGNRNVGRIDEIIAVGGVDTLIESLTIRLKASEDGDIVGVIVDADTDLESRWNAVRSRLVGLDYTDVPLHPQQGGTILDPPIGSMLPRFGVWLMPDNKTPGILEDFLQFLIPAGSKLFEHVKSSVESIPEDERRFTELARPKVDIHTWLAWQDEPGKPLGIAITAKYLDSHTATVDVFISWLNRRFFPSVDVN